MENPISKANRDSSSIIFNNYFSANECAQIINLSEFKTFKEDNNLITKSFAELTKKHWLTEKLNTLINHANQSYFDFDVSMLNELYLFECREGAILDWRMDIGPGLSATRKITFFVFLSENNNYEGGKINFCLIKPQKEYIEQGCGKTILFPAFKPYILEEVTKGTVYFLNGFMHGNSFY